MKVWSTLETLLKRSEPAVLVSILAVKGSAPREAGARMIVTGGGYHGTIGGGALEWQALGQAQRLLAAGDGKAFTDRKLLGPDLGQCCGGAVDLLFECFDAADLAHVAELAVAEAGGPFATTGRLGGRHLQRAIDGTREEARAVTGNIREQFGEQRRTVMLFGAGHVGRAVMLAMAPLPFDVRWLDPRPGAFPAHVAGNVTTDARPDPTTVIADAPDGAFIVIVTHSHALDLALLDAALTAGSFAYVGVIGSATKRARFASRLRQAGHGEDAIASFHCPIGVKGIASRLPAAIAAGLVAQLLQHDAQVETTELPLNIARQRA